MGKLEFKKAVREPQDVMADAVYAALETGNQAGARTALKVLSDEYPITAARLAVEVRKEYGAVL